MYYLRKLSKLSTKAKIRNVNNIAEIPADILKQELPTTNNTLSVWKFDSFDSIDNAVRAALLSSTGVAKTDFVVFDDELLKSNNINLDDSEEGKTGYFGFGKLHVNLCDLDYAAIGRVLFLIKIVITDEKYDRYSFQMSRNEVKECISDVCKEGLLDMETINPQLLDDINKFYELTI